MVNLKKESKACTIITWKPADKQAWSRPGCVKPKGLYYKWRKLTPEDIEILEQVKAGADINSLKLTVYKAYELGLMTQQAVDDLKCWTYTDPDLELIWPDPDDHAYFESLDGCWWDMNDEYWRDAWGDAYYREDPEGGFLLDW